MATKELRPSQRAFTFHTSAFAMVAGCNRCNHVEREDRPRKPGSAWGWTTRNALTRRMNQHIKDKHP